MQYTLIFLLILVLFQSFCIYMLNVRLRRINQKYGRNVSKKSQRRAIHVAQAQAAHR